MNLNEKLNDFNINIIIFLLTLVAFYLRVRNVGELGFAGDEEFTAMAVNGIMKTGYPVMPSGMEYWRGLPFSYLVAFSIKIFGDGETAYRLPSVIFGALKVPLVYLFCKKLINRDVALLSAAILTFSVWDIQFSRVARMYSTFAFFYLLSLFSFYRGYIEGNKVQLIVAPLLIVSITFIHLLGSFLVTLFLLPFLIGSSSRGIRKICLVLLPIISLMDFVIIKFIGAPYKVYLRRGIEKSVDKSSLNLVDSIFSSIPNFQLPKFELFNHFSDFYPVAFSISIILLLLMFIVLAVMKLPGLKNSPQMFISALLLLACLAHQYMIASGILLYSLYKSGDRTGSNIRSDLAIRVGIVLSTGLIWLAYGYFIWKGHGYEIGGSFDLVRKIIKALIFYPPIDIRTFLYLFPRMTAMVFIAVIVMLSRCFKDNVNHCNFYLIYVLFVPLLLSGLMKEWTQPRYSYHLYPIFIILYCWATLTTIRSIIKIMEKRAGALPKRHYNPVFKNKEGRVVLTCILLFLTLSLTLQRHWVVEAYAVSDTAYGNDTGSSMGGYDTYPDHKGAGEYVRKHIKNDDIVIAEDVYQQTYYVGKVDYRIEGWAAPLASVDKSGRNISTDSRMIHDLEELIDALSSAKSRAWIITTSEFTPEDRKDFVEENIEAFYIRHSAKVVFTGQDSSTKVYLFDRKSGAIELEMF